MSTYINYIDHPKYGRLWFEAWLRNWCALGETMEQNIKSGPLVELVLDDYSICTLGKDLEAALRHLDDTLRFYEQLNKELPIPVKRPWWKEKWEAFRLKRLFKRFRKNGFTNPVRRTN